MATTDPAGRGPRLPGPALIPRLTADEVARRNRALAELLRSWESEGDEREQRETLAVLREALGGRRVASRRSLLP